MDSVNYHTVFNVPPLEQLERWATPRLLRFYRVKSILSCKVAHNYAYDYDAKEEINFIVEYVNKIKEMLNKREHVVRK